jgi:hypothetical protein
VNAQRFKESRPMRLASPRLASPRLASPRLTSPHLTAPHLTTPHHVGPHLVSPHLVLPSAPERVLLFSPHLSTAATAHRRYLLLSPPHPPPPPPTHHHHHPHHHPHPPPPPRVAPHAPLAAPLALAALSPFSPCASRTPRLAQPASRWTASGRLCKDRTRPAE